MILPPRLQPVAAFARREILAVLALLALAVAAEVFLSVAGEVREGETNRIDLAVLRALRVPGQPHQPIGPHWLETAAGDFTSLGSIVVLAFIVLVVAGLFVSLRRRREALVVVIASGGGLITSGLLKALFARARPDPVYRAVEATTSSFPSGHAMLSAIVFLTLGSLCAGYVDRRLVKTYIMTVALAATLAIGLTRIYLGVHWLTDVLAGWSVGAVWATGCWLAVWALDQRWREGLPGSAVEVVVEQPRPAQLQRLD